MTENKKYTGCKSWLCKQCKHYVKFLTVSTMQGICWNRGCFYESEDEIQPEDATDSDGRYLDEKKLLRIAPKIFKECLFGR